MLCEGEGKWSACTYNCFLCFTISFGGWGKRKAGAVDAAPLIHSVYLISWLLSHTLVITLCLSSRAFFLSLDCTW